MKKHYIVMYLLCDNNNISGEVIEAEDYDYAVDKLITKYGLIFVLNFRLLFYDENGILEEVF